MKISYKSGAGDWTVLADDAAGSFILGFRVVMRPAVQVEGLFRSKTPKVFPRDNRQWSVTFAVSREHASADAAVEFLATHATAIPGSVHLKIDQGVKTVYGFNAGITQIELVDDTNKSTIISYQFVCEDYRLTAP